MNYFHLLLVGSIVAATETVRAETSLPWPDKDGPTADGHVPPAHAEGLPLRWDEKTGENIVWKTPLEHAGHSTPVIDRERLWFTAATEDGTEQFIYALDRETGAVRHHRRIFENASPEPLGNQVNTYASPSCVLEEGAVYVHFGTYGTARLAPETAEVVWQRRDIHCRHFRGPGSSPILFDELLILTMDGIDQQYLIALDKATGKTVWRTDRSTDYGDLDADGQPIAEGDLRKAYGTPAIAAIDGQAQLLSVGSRAAFGYEPRTGKEIWTVTHPHYNAAARPLSRGNLVILNTGSSRALLLGLRLDAEAKGDITASHIAWERDKRNSQFSRPTLVGDRLFQVTDGGILSCVDVQTGREIWSDRLEGTYVASPVIANGQLYFVNELGTTFVVKAADAFERVAQNVLDGQFQASPAVAEGALYLRSRAFLYKIAAAKTES